MTLKSSENAYYLSLDNATTPFQTAFNKLMNFLSFTHSTVEGTLIRLNIIILQNY